MVYKDLKQDIMKMFENEESIDINIRKLEDGSFLVRITADSGATKMVITEDWEALFSD
jgi:hypothetical protein